MKNIIILVLFFFGLAGLYFIYFIPSIDKRNNLDQIDAVLQQVKTKVSLDTKVYFLSETDIKINPEIYYKVQFSLAPRVVIAEKYSNIPAGSYVVFLQNNAAKQEDFVGYNESELLQIKNDDFFNLKFLKKKP